MRSQRAQESGGRPFDYAQAQVGLAFVRMGHPIVEYRGWS